MNKSKKFLKNDCSLNKIHDTNEKESFQTEVEEKEGDEGDGGRGEGNEKR